MIKPKERESDKSAASGPNQGLQYIRAAISIAAGLVLWEIMSLLLGSGRIPAPMAVWSTAGHLLTSGILLTDILYSVSRVAIAFALAVLIAIPIGFLLGWYESLRTLIEPWIQFFRMIPPIALIPLVIVYFGIGETAKIWIIFFAAFLVMVVSVYQGVVAVNALYIKAAKALGAHDFQLFWNVVIPSSIPYIVVGMRIAVAASWTTLVAAELVAASHGLGYLIMSASQYYSLPTVYLGIIVIGLIGLMMDRLVQRLERRLTIWTDRR